MFCSVIIPTIGRPTLTRAVESVLSQAFTADDFEVIVVNDSGRPLAKADWQQSERVRVINTNRRERSVARNTGAAIANGDYLHFLDDDDWLAPDALENLRTVAQTSDAAWLYGSSQLMDRHGKPIFQLHHGLSGNCFIQTMAGEWIPLQSSLIKAEMFFAIGGFNPLIAGTEDIDLLRRISLHSDIAEMQKIVAYIVMGEEGSTTDYERHPEISRWAREIILNSTGVFERMRASATTSYWYGRILRAYMTSLVWNLRRKRLLRASSRAMYGLGALILGRPYLLSAGFWRAVVRSYTSETFVKACKKRMP
jgi:glycosyltransferase involved in cell wall biosynthesis